MILSCFCSLPKEYTKLQLRVANEAQTNTTALCHCPGSVGNGDDRWLWAGIFRINGYLGGAMLCRDHSTGLCSILHAWELPHLSHRPGCCIGFAWTLVSLISADIITNESNIARISIIIVTLASPAGASTISIKLCKHTVIINPMSTTWKQLELNPLFMIANGTILSWYLAEKMK